MKKYVKPMVLVNEELAEGVYAASGETNSSNESALTVNTSNTGGWGSTSVVKVVVTNNSSEEATGWSATVTFDDEINDVNAYGNYNASINGSNVTFTSAYSWNQTIAANSSITFEAQVTGKNIAPSVK